MPTRATVRRPRRTRRVAAAATLRLRPRLYAGGDIALGPGKAALLGAIDTTGSIRLAAAQLDMSYDRAWKLVRTMNACFAHPLVVARRGGATRGEAHLTPDGQRVLALYVELLAACTQAARPWAGKLRRQLARSR